MLSQCSFSKHISPPPIDNLIRHKIAAGGASYDQLCVGPPKGPAAGLAMWHALPDQYVHVTTHTLEHFRELFTFFDHRSAHSLPPDRV